MSLAITKTNFEQLIGDRNNGVIALSGKWGTGKSHMWRQVQNDSIDDAIRGALYVSLFGVKDILQLKLKIVQSAVPDTKTGHVAREVVTSAWRQSSKFLKTLHPGFAALDEIALLAVPAILRNRVIVIDDIERKHAALSIEEVMGFIDEFTQVYGSRILLILNSDQLGDKAMWEKLREKVIDHEIALNTTPEEAFGIASGGEPSPFAAHIQGAVQACKISNIRIIQKIIRTVNRLLGGRPNLDDDVLKRTVPSAVLLAAVHYKGLHDGPDFDYLSRYNSLSRRLAQRGKTKKAEEETEEDRREVRWALLMSALNIYACDEYEELVMAFLKSGLLDSAKTNAILDRYVAEKNAFSAQQRCREFFDLELWSPECTEADLLAKAKALAANTHYLDCYSITSLHSSVAALPDGQSLADHMIADWVAKFKAKAHAEFDYSNNFFKRELHPDIEAEFKALKSKLAPLPSLLEVCVSIIQDSGWGSAQEDTMKASSPAQYEAEIKKLAGEDLKTFMLKSMDMYVNRATYASFGDAMWHFVAACRTICHENANPRRSKMIRLVFSDSHLASLLDVYDRPVAETAARAEPAPHLATHK